MSDTPKFRVAVEFNGGDARVFDSIHDAAQEIEGEFLFAHYVGNECTLSLAHAIRENEKLAADERATINTLRSYSL